MAADGRRRAVADGGAPTNNDNTVRGRGEGKREEEGAHSPETWTGGRQWDSDGEAATMFHGKSA